MLLVITFILSIYYWKLQTHRIACLIILKKLLQFVSDLMNSKLKYLIIALSKLGFKPRLREQFLWQFLFARIDEQNWAIFVWQLYLMKNWRVSFCVANKNCHIQKIIRVDETTHFLTSSIDPSFQSFVFK